MVGIHNGLVVVAGPRASASSQASSASVSFAARRGETHRPIRRKREGRMATRFDASQGPRIVGPRDGTTLDLGSCGARLMISGEESGGGFSLVEHPIPPRHLAAPLHRHIREDEYSVVLEGRLGTLLGDDVVYAEPGHLVFKPRAQ
jgi:mannose-6-phosphate isomerase-like protein (cupin superfamily)